MFPRGFFWGAVFGAFGGVITILCLNRAWRNELAVMANGRCVNFCQDIDEGICLAVVFGAIGGMIAVLWLNAVWRAEEAEDGAIEDQYEESQKQAVEHDENVSVCFCFCES